MSSNIVHVAVAVITNQKQQVLISKRPDDVHLGGFWEFPGGKVEINESIEDALQREMKEELDIEIINYRPLIKITHHYSDKSVLLDVWKVTQYSGEIKGNEGQPINWKAPAELNSSDFPAADISILQAIKLPSRCLITGQFNSQVQYIERLNLALTNGITLVQCRINNQMIEKFGEVCIKRLIADAALLCKEKGATFVLNCPDKLNLNNIEYLHLNSIKLMACESRPNCQTLSASCHNEKELSKAIELGANFVFLSPVKMTTSHPDATTLGWQKFSEMVNDVNIPVYALGGMKNDDLSDAWNAGAQGIAAIGCFWN